MENNYVIVSGKVSSKPKYSHHVFGEGFYEFDLAVKRLSDYQDIIPITVSERLLSGINLTTLKDITVYGQFRSYNKFDGEKSRLMLSVFARSIEEFEESDNPNIVELSGYICKEPIFRTTPFKREICDVLVAVNRQYNKSDYIPCIAWGRNARFLSNMKVGDKLDISGRIQSREYVKQTVDGEITKTAYEVSINKMTSYDLKNYFYEYNFDEVGAEETTD